MKMKLLTLILIIFTTINTQAQQPKDSSAAFTKMAEAYRKMGLPETTIQMMVQAERERLYPAIKQKADVKRNEDSKQKAQANNSTDDEDDDEAEKMMDKAIRKMGKDPTEIKKKMANTPETNLKEIPKLSARLIATTPATEAAMIIYLTTMLLKAESVLSGDKKIKANKYVGKGRETGYVGVVFWINKEHDLALYLMLKACVEMPQDNLLLNNFATCLSMSGLPEKAIPILDYLSNKLPENGNVFNNLGQAWLSMGNISKAKPLLEKAVVKDKVHAEANSSLGKIAVKEGNTSKAVSYFENSITGGLSSETFNQWARIAPNKDVSNFIRGNHKKSYKEVPITKRWVLPDIPSSVTEAQEKEGTISQFFANMEATLSDMPNKIEELSNAKMEKEEKRFLQMQQQSMNMKTMDDVNKYNNQFGKYFHIYKFKAQLMLNAIRSRDYATSYTQRIEQAAVVKQNRLAILYKALKILKDKIAVLNKEIGRLEGGENGDDELKIAAIEKQICPLTFEVQNTELTELSAINNQYAKEVESILNQRLQEEMYWTTLYTLPNNPTGDLYKLYETYLSDLYLLKGLYPLPAPLKLVCNERDNHKAAAVTGKMQLWEDSHCPIDINYDVIIAQAKMNCREIFIGAKFKDITVGWERKIDPVTWETLEHSISIAAGLKEFEKKITKDLTGKVTVEGKVTIKLDADLLPTDLIVKTQAGAELSGPLGGKAGVDLGSIEISVQGGLRGEGAVPDLVSKMFGN